MREEPAVPFVFLVLAGLALAILLVPVVIVVLAGLNAGDYLTFPPQGLSLRWIKAFLSSPTFVPAYIFSFGLAAVTTACSTILGTAAALYLTRSESRLVGVMRGFFMLPIVLPGVVLGLALYVFFASQVPVLKGSFFALLVGHVLVTSPFVIATVSASLVGFDRSLEEAARSLGATAWQAFMQITFRIVSPGIAAGALFAFIISFGQFEVTLFLSVPNQQPLPVAMYISLRYAFEPIAAAAGIFAIALVVVSTVATARLVNLRRLFQA